jgi:phosphate transport system substrate-binding protein
MRTFSVSLLSLPLALQLACSSQRQAADDGGSGAGAEAGASAKSGGDTIIRIDGSSTVFPITEAVAEEFGNETGAKVTIGVSGTGGGFKKFCGGETQVSGASRPIKPTEVEMCGKAGIEYVELPVAYDGIAIVVNPQNDWVDRLTVAELKMMWAPEAQDTVKKWSQIREGWPDEEIHLMGPGVDSGTYDYFTKAIVGKEHSSRGDFTSSEDDNVLVKGVAGDKLALAFFGFAYYAENKAQLKVVPVDDGDESNGAGGVEPSTTSVSDGTYQPLSRPIFIYVAKDRAQGKVAEFVDYYLGPKGAPLVAEVGYIPLPEKVRGLAQKRFADRVTGSIFGGGGSKIGVSVESMLAGG